MWVTLIMCSPNPTTAVTVCKSGLTATGLFRGRDIERLGANNSILDYKQKVITGREGGLAPAGFRV